MGEGHSPWAQVVQAALDFHVDQEDPEQIQTERGKEHNIKLLCIVDNESVFVLSAPKQFNSLDVKGMQ